MFASKGLLVLVVTPVKQPSAALLQSSLRAATPLFYCRSNTRMFGSLRSTECTVIVKVLRSEESLICWVSMILPSILSSFPERVRSPGVPRKQNLGPRWDLGSDNPSHRISRFSSLLPRDRRRKGRPPRRAGPQAQRPSSPSRLCLPTCPRTLFPLPFACTHSSG